MTKDEDEEFTLGSHVLALWEKRSKNLIHDYAVTGWALSVQPEICSHCINLLTGSQHLQIEQVIVKLHQKPYPNLNVINESIEDVVDVFWKDFKSTDFPLTILDDSPPKMLCLAAIIFGMRCTHCLILMYLGL